MIRIKRIYDKPSDDDGYRVLVDRLWPRGMKKEIARIDVWLKDAAPSDELRKWFNHEPEKWNDFKEKYFMELQHKKGVLDSVIERINQGLTLLYGAKDERHNNAAALKEYLEEKILQRSNEQ